MTQRETDLIQEIMTRTRPLMEKIKHATGKRRGMLELELELFQRVKRLCKKHVGGLSPLN